MCQAGAALEPGAAKRLNAAAGGRRFVAAPPAPE
jgi:hypothetical protein